MPVRNTQHVFSTDGLPTIHSISLFSNVFHGKYRGVHHRRQGLPARRGLQEPLESLVPSSRSIIPYLWARGKKLDDRELSVRSHSAIGDIRVIDEIDTAYLVRVTWNPNQNSVLEVLTQTDVTLLAGYGTEEDWTFEVRGDDHKAISAFQQACRDCDIPITLTNLYALSSRESSDEFDLTDTQREALVLAYERGYFRSPRQASLEEIARELGITGQSLGSQIRRGTHRLIGSTSSAPDIRPTSL